VNETGKFGPPKHFDVAPPTRSISVVCFCFIMFIFYMLLAPLRHVSETHWLFYMGSGVFMSFVPVGGSVQQPTGCG
jgi:hypothetical protein